MESSATPSLNLLVSIYSHLPYHRAMADNQLHDPGLSQSLGSIFRNRPRHALEHRSDKRQSRPRSSTNSSSAAGHSHDRDCRSRPTVRLASTRPAQAPSPEPEQDGSPKRNRQGMEHIHRADDSGQTAINRAIQRPVSSTRTAAPTILLYIHANNINSDTNSEEPARRITQQPPPFTTTKTTPTPSPKRSPGKRNQRSGPPSRP